jgi:hypothetical protein
MVIVMEISSGKVLDEACNNNNDVYSDEVLYASWAEPRRIETVLDSVVASARANLDGFMARLYVCQE